MLHSLNLDSPNMNNEVKYKITLGEERWSADFRDKFYAWTRDNKVYAETCALRSNGYRYYLEFKHEADAVAYKLTFPNE